MEAVASGDVDSLRLLLRGETPKPATDRPEPPPPDSLPALFRGVPQLRLRVSADCEVNLLSSRVMGKVVWPAAHATALHLLALPPAATFVEVGAGAGLPSLVAARDGGMTVVATECTEAGVELLRANSFHNGGRLRHIARLDLADTNALADLLAQIDDTATSASARGGVCVCACDMSYDEACVSALFASLRVLADTRRERISLLFARSSYFEHMDDHTLACARERGFGAADRRRVVAGGVLDCAGAHYESCADDVVDILTFETTSACAAWPGGDTSARIDAVISSNPHS